MTSNEAKQIAHNSLVETGYTILNKKLWDNIGLRPTILIQTLMSIHKQWFNGLDEFYQQTDRLSEHCRCSERQIKNDLNALQVLELLTVVKKGLPCKNFYSINYENVVKILLQDDSSQAKIARLDEQILPDK